MMNITLFHHRAGLPVRQERACGREQRHTRQRQNLPAHAFPTLPSLPRPTPPLRLRPLRGQVGPGPARARVRRLRAHVGVGRGPRAQVSVTSPTVDTRTTLRARHQRHSTPLFATSVARAAFPSCRLIKVNTFMVRYFWIHRPQELGSIGGR
ncbi:hypothetical protein B0H11DRAFT_340314 [Mycena galericulata]|nr:hypothetical protein B0H11DRAFT_340314 [Mycena galericulata]